MRSWKARSRFYLDMQQHTEKSDCNANERGCLRETKRVMLRTEAFVSRNRRGDGDVWGRLVYRDTCALFPCHRFMLGLILPQFRRSDGHKANLCGCLIGQVDWRVPEHGSEEGLAKLKAIPFCGEAQAVQPPLQEPAHGIRWAQSTLSVLSMRSA